MPRPGDKPRPDDKPGHEHEAELGLRTWTHIEPAPEKPNVQKTSFQGGAPANYHGGAEPARHEGSHPDDHALEGGAGDQHQPSNQREDRPALPDRASAGGADQLERGTSLADNGRTAGRTG
jgi:hypothetical protein